MNVNISDEFNFSDVHGTMNRSRMRARLNCASRLADDFLKGVNRLHIFFMKISHWKKMIPP